MNFNYNLPVNLIFGSGESCRIGIEVCKYGKKALIVTGKNSTKKSGLLDKAIDLLKISGVTYVIFDKVEQNPLTTTIYEGVALAKNHGCDVILGIGGGSIMDAAKAIAFAIKNPGDISDYIFGTKAGCDAVNLVLVPTTCGTGSEGNSFAVLTNPATKDKKSLRDNKVIAKASIIDPQLMMTMPKDLIASVGFDALCHNMEAYLSKSSQPLTDIQALYGMKLISENLPIIYNDNNNLEAFEKVTLGSTLGGMVIGVVGVTAAHGLEHPASGLRDIAHGKGLAALTPIITDMSYKSNLNKYKNISKILGGASAEDCGDSIRLFLDKINLRISLGQIGINNKDVDWMAENTFKVSKASIQNHPKEFSIEEIKEIYYKSI